MTKSGQLVLKITKKTGGIRQGQHDKQDETVSTGQAGFYRI
jgi:hypothetical protein